MPADDLAEPPDLAAPSDSSDDDAYVSVADRRLGVFALRYTAPPALITALLFGALNYWWLVRGQDEAMSWYGANGDSFLELYLPSAILLPLIQVPLLLRRTLGMRISGRLEPPLDAELKQLPWVQWSIALALMAGGVWTTITMGVFTIAAVWFPDAQIGVWAGLSFRLAFTAVIGMSVAILCAVAAVRINPDANLLERVLDSSDGAEDAAGDPVVAADIAPARDLVDARAAGPPDRRGRLEVPTGSPRKVVWDRWRVGVRPEVRGRAESAVYFAGAHRYAFLRRFFILLSLSVLMASFGLYTNSAPVVVAAMMIAPLMTPIMGLTLALVTGHPARQIESALLVAGATGYIIVLTWLTGVLMPDPPVLPDVLLDYTDPKLADLFIALLAGAVGIYILVHTEASTALPGVAVAISLEPPIAATGMTLAWGLDEHAIGAFLMYTLNLAAIIGAGSLVLILSGFLPVSTMGHLPRRIKVGLITTAVALVVVAYPLYRVSTSIWRQTSEIETVGAIVIPWAEAQELDPTNILVEDDEVIIDLSGSDEPTSVDELAADVSEALGRSVDVHVRLHPYTLI